MRFGLAYLLTGALAIAAVAAVYLADPRGSGPRHAPSGPEAPLVQPRIPQERWGHAQQYRHVTVLALGPVADRRRRYEAATARITFSAASLAVSNDGGKTFQDLAGEPMGACGYHWSGYGVNAITAIEGCVPWWATDPGGAHAHQWLRIENLVPVARFVLMRLSG